MEEIWCNLRDRKFPERGCFFNSKPEKIEEYIYKSGCQVCSYFKEVILTRLAQKDEVTVIEKPKVKRKISRSSLSHEKSEHIFDKSELIKMATGFQFPFTGGGFFTITKANKKAIYFKIKPPNGLTKRQRDIFLRDCFERERKFKKIEFSKSKSRNHLDKKDFYFTCWELYRKGMNNREIARRVFSNEDPDDARKKVSNFIKAMRKKIEEAIWIS